MPIDGRRVSGILRIEPYDGHPQQGNHLKTALESVFFSLLALELYRW